MKKWMKMQREGRIGSYGMVLAKKGLQINQMGL
jgi:hypothetical protein